ncbi:hypothetical protein BGZ80_008512 [Entomortierella chlamydospora]|uniref:Uncharacterized protein n=1 Tax=Entomortierella chlamydospora TaxID=101097 RepID=A0A9P6T124_9FUNG|nr:hypothetical protein BGZ80_008512 [Entomortierella chlamydospora]
MNHKTIEVKDRLGELPPINHFPTQSLQHNRITKDSKRTPTGPGDSNEVQETKIANSLLAAILACYKNAVINTSTPSYPLNLQKDLASYMERQTSEAVQSISTGGSDLERQAANIALTSTCIKDALPLIDLQQDACEDIEFRALVLRIAKKIGVAKLKSLLEQRKARLYYYLDHVISDPTRYSQQENIIAVSGMLPVARLPRRTPNSNLSSSQ